MHYGIVLENENRGPKIVYRMHNSSLVGLHRNLGNSGDTWGIQEILGEIRRYSEKNSITSVLLWSLVIIELTAPFTKVMRTSLSICSDDGCPLEWSWASYFWNIQQKHYTSPIELDKSQQFKLTTVLILNQRNLR